MKVKDRSLKRRTFLKLGATGLTTLTLPLGKQAFSGPSLQEKKGKFIYRTLGKTGLKVPIVSMGVMNADNPNLVQAALDAGILLLDTAHTYQRGRNETMIGQVIKGRPRDSFYIATKVPGPSRDKSLAELPSREMKKAFLEKFETSLKRLGLDCVEIFYLHNITTAKDALFEPMLEALQQAKKEGKARFIGVSTHKNEPEVIRAAIQSNIYDVVLTSFNFRQDHREEVRRAIREASQAGLGICIMKTQAGVYWDREKTQPINMKAALKWALNEPHAHTAIPGMTTFDQLELDLSVMEDLTLTEAELQDLKLASQAPGYFCQQCDQCLPTCRQSLPLSTLMRAYMYAASYGNLSQAYAVVSSLDLPDNPCQTCSTCSAKCVKGMEIGPRIQDVLKIRSLPESLLI
ncbi:MAG: hypothetical protein B5M54_08185 [Candidatus Aminicenantes bacterium 4484_214]|nr:MAG: hypothetical protein B5M54_08185 [Candidatus Aminicenantes bacterium 4484_214]